MDDPGWIMITSISQKKEGQMNLPLCEFEFLTMCAG
jgi:hypothetical protein